MTKKTYASARCSICGCTVIVWRQGAVKASLLRRLALFDHHLALHEKPRWAGPPRPLRKA